MSEIERKNASSRVRLRMAEEMENVTLERQCGRSIGEREANKMCRILDTGYKA